MMTENSDNNEIDSNAVAEFLKANGISVGNSDRLPDKGDVAVEEEPAPMEEEEEPAANTPLIPSDVQQQIAEACSDDKAPQEEEYENVRLTPDSSFETNEREKANEVFVPVLDINVPITQEDKDAYFKAMLFDLPVELPIVSMEGKVTIVCRALNVYENDLVYVALEKAMKAHKLPAAMWEGLCQQYRLVMQLVKFNGTPMDCVRFDEPGDSQKDADVLLEGAKRIYKIGMVKYNLFIRSLNVFQYKVNKLNEAIYNQGFWNPVGTD